MGDGAPCAMVYVGPLPRVTPPALLKGEIGETYNIAASAVKNIEGLARPHRTR